ncbi:hypothetical protein GUJ93_ZPchr0010g10459 [Zizania palustris]|uniref:Uncharacterized protein n=1 Tax=Zizania palustris TaxID=103762 RepID=A0A8J5W889_ZIZPA|nr:hypothetical protein GUJ93_ZPchr0010g10459 [Zizania palustris]
MAGPITNLLVIPIQVNSRVHQRRKFHAFKLPKLERICKPKNETMALLLLPSDLSKNVNSNPARFQSSNLLAEQILDLEERRTPEAVEMIIGTNTEDQVKNQTMAMEMTNMNMLLQGRLFDVMDAREDED